MSTSIQPSEKPVILIGTQRSGTTWMGRVLSTDDSLTYLVEPRHVWSWGHNYRRHDVLDASDASPRIRTHIRRTFDRLVRLQGRDRLCEKTPSNCLRIPFIHAIYPSAKFIFVTRDGRAVLRSTGNILKSGMQGRRIFMRARQTPLWEWPAFIPQAWEGLASRMLGRRMRYWGPRPIGWQAWVKEESPEIVLARQWSTTMTRACRDLQSLPTGSYYQYTYEDMMDRPGDIMQEIVDFAELPAGKALVDRAVQSADPSRKDAWRNQLDEGVLTRVRPYMEETLEMLGYDW